MLSDWPRSKHGLNMGEYGCGGGSRCGAEFVVWMSCQVTHVCKNKTDIMFVMMNVTQEGVGTKWERIMVPIIWHFSKLNSTFYGNLWQPEFVNFGY